MHVGSRSQLARTCPDPRKDELDYAELKQYWDAQGLMLSHEWLMHAGRMLQLAHTSLAPGRVLPYSKGYEQSGDAQGQMFSRESQAHVDGKSQLAHICPDLRKDELESAG